MADILIVEDDEEVAFLVEMFLEAEGHHVRRAGNGEEGLARLSEGRRLPDVVVTDVEMPLLDGPDMAAQMLVENVGRERIPLVVVSGIVGLPQVARRIGTPYYLAKPFAPNDLLALVGRALREGRYPHPARLPGHHRAHP